MFIVIQKPNSNKVFLSYLIPAIAANYILRTTNFRSTFQIQGMYIHNLRSVRMCEFIRSAQEAGDFFGEVVSHSGATRYYVYIYPVYPRCDI